MVPLPRGEFMNIKRGLSHRYSFLSIICTSFLVIALLSQTVWAAPSSDKLKKEQAGKQSELDSLNAEKESLDSELASYIDQIAKVKEEQEKTAAALEKAQAEVDAQYVSMGERIRFMYEEGSASLLEVLLESESMGDFLNKAYYVSTISDYDRQMLEELQVVSNKVEKKKAELKEEREELEKLQAERLEKQEALADQIDAAKKELAAAKKAVEEATEAEKAEAEKKLQEAQAKAAQVAGTTPTGSSSSNSSSSGSGSSGSSGGGSSSGSWSGQKLTPSAGTIMGPSGKETYYNLDMSGVVRIMRSIGNNDPYWVRSDGVKMLGNYVMVAANFSIRPRGSYIQTSLGMGIVCDTGGFAAHNPTQLDIAVDW